MRTKIIILLIGFLGHFCVAMASPVTTGVWYNARWTGGPGTFLTNGFGSVGTTDPGAAPWTFTAVGPTELFVIDCCTSGDTFTVMVNGVSVGTTPSPVGSATCYGPPAGCVGVPSMSQGSFLLPLGADSIELILATAAPGTNSGEAYFRLDNVINQVPEPATLAMLGVGAGALVAVRCRRRAQLA